MNKTTTGQMEKLLSIAINSDCISCRKLAVAIKDIMRRKVEFSSETMGLLKSSFLHHDAFRHKLIQDGEGENEAR